MNTADYNKRFLFAAQRFVQWCFFIFYAHNKTVIYMETNPIQPVGKKIYFSIVSVGVVILLPILFLSCVIDPEDDGLAPYAGTRPFIMEKVTQSYTSDIAWLGGRVAAVGVNQGSVAALDSTLIWLRTADDNSISSPATVGENTDVSGIEAVGGVPQDSLENQVEYTFWIAGRDAYDGGLNPSALNEYNFMDTTMTPQLYVGGRSGGGTTADGDPVATIRLIRDERITGERYIVEWDEGTPVRRVAIRQASTGGFTDLIWHIVTPDDLEDNITSPLIIGDIPDGVNEVISWPESGFEYDTVYIVWMATKDWTEGTFTPSATGYAWFRLFPISE